MKKIVGVLIFLAGNSAFTQENVCPSASETAEKLKQINQQVRSVVEKAKVQASDLEDADFDLRLNLRDLIIKLENCGK